MVYSDRLVEVSVLDFSSCGRLHECASLTLTRLQKTFYRLVITVRMRGNVTQYYAVEFSASSYHKLDSRYATFLRPLMMSQSHLVHSCCWSIRSNAFMYACTMYATMCCYTIPVPYNLILRNSYDTIRFNRLPCTTIQWNRILYNTIKSKQYNYVQHNKMP